MNRRGTLSCIPLAPFVIVAGNMAFAAPVARFDVEPNPAAPGASITFDGTRSSADPGHGLVRYEWDFGYYDGDFRVDAVGSILMHKYDQFGSYTAALRVIDNTYVYSDIATILISVNLGNRPPVANAGGPYTIYSGGSVLLNGEGSTEPDEGYGDWIESYSWYLNADGIPDAIGARATLTWSDLQGMGLHLGENTISLEVTDTFGATGVAQTTISMLAAAPPIPEPLTMLTAFLGVVGLGGYTRRHVRKARAQIV